MPLCEAGSSEDLQDLYDNAPCGYLSLTPRGRIVKVNRTLSDWLGQPADDLLHRGIHDILSFGGKIAYETHLAPLLRLQGHVHEIALDLLDAQGQKIPVIANAMEKRSPQGEHLFTRLTVFKAVDRRTFERSLIEARLKAESERKTEREAARLRDQFIAVLGHDLRNPLGAVLAGTRLLSNADGLGERERRIVAQMESTIERANSLIDDVLDFARGKLGDGLTLVIDPDRSLPTMLDHVVQEMRVIYPDRSFETRLSIDHKVHCDPDRIAQMASNLLANAVTHGSDDSAVLLEARTTDDVFTLAVTNSGERISEPALSQLFRPFFRGQVSNTRKGLGLGLYIVSEIARAHRGNMDVASTDDHSCFTFTMPRLPESALSD